LGAPPKYFSEESTYFSGTTTQVGDLAKYLIAEQWPLDESIKHLSDYDNPLEAFANYFTWFARHLAKLARYFSDLPIDSEAFANHFYVLPGRISLFACYLAEPANQSSPLIRVQAE